MPTRIVKDAVTGVDTTGHEWDGISELNNPLPRWWLYTFYACILFAVVWWVLFPSWPWVHGYWHGLIGSNQRVDLDERMAHAHEQQKVWLDKIAATDPKGIIADPQLLTFALAGGAIAFNNNCAPCHGLGGGGQAFFPALVDDDWLWGGSLDNIQKTITDGIRNGSEDARDSQMPAFGADGLLKRDQIADLTQYVLSLSDKAGDQAAAERGKPLFAENCAACHGEEGKGNQDLGAPNLTDAIWLYGGTADAIQAQIWRPRQGVMPTWKTRLDENTIKMLTVYVHSLGGGQ